MNYKFAKFVFDMPPVDIHLRKFVRVSWMTTYLHFIVGYMSTFIAVGFSGDISPPSYFLIGVAVLVAFTGFLYLAYRYTLYKIVVRGYF